MNEVDSFKDRTYTEIINDTKEISSNLSGSKEIERKDQIQSYRINDQFEKEKINFKDKKTDFKDILKKFRNRLFERGIRGLVGLGKAFKLRDFNNDNLIQLDEFIVLCKEIKLSDENMSFDDLKQLFETFDVDNSKSINYNEFIRSIRGPMNK